MSRRISRGSNVPIAATMAAATGPHANADAKMGAMVTLTTDPRGVCTGNIEAASATTVQNATPTHHEVDAPSPGASVTTPAARNSKMAVVLTATIAATRALDNLGLLRRRWWAVSIAGQFRPP